MLALLVSKYMLPGSGPAMVEYKNLQAEISKTAEPTLEQFQRRDALFLELNSASNIKQDIIGYVVKNVVFFITILPLMFVVARYSGLESNTVLLTAALIFIPFIFVKFFITGAILASSFVLGGIAFRKQPKLAEGVDQGESSQ